MLNLSTAYGQSIKVDKTELTTLVKVCEKCQADLEDYKAINGDQKLILEAMQVRLNEKELTIQGLNGAISKLKIAYNELDKKHRKKKFWVWLKGFGTGVVAGAITVVILML